MATNSANSKILKRGTYTIRSMAFPLNSAHLKSNVDHGFVTASPNDDSDSYKVGFPHSNLELLTLLMRTLSSM